MRVMGLAVAAMVVAVQVSFCAMVDRAWADDNEARADVAATLGEFQLVTVAASEDTYMPMVRPTVLHAGQAVFHDELVASNFGMEEKADFPSPGCTTLLVSTWSGGAHCCFAHYLMTRCTDGDHFSVIDTGNLEGGGPNGPLDPEDMNRDGTFELRVADNSFAYYATGDHSLCFACSPLMPRLLLWDVSGWRADRPGEYPAYYTKLLAEEASTEPDPASAIYEAYLLAMAGHGQATIQARLTELLPEDWKPSAQDIFRDVMHGVDTFDPLRVRESF